MKLKYFVEIGQRFDKLTVIEEFVKIGFDKTRRNGVKRRYVKCLCDCGGTITMFTRQLFTQAKIGHSCGCISKTINRTHGEAKSSSLNGRPTNLYQKWHGMISRAIHPYNASYKYYGGRGITVCKEWEDYTVFAEWARQNGYDEKLQIDRIDTNGNYEPGNCRFVTNQINARNKRRRPDNGICYNQHGFIVRLDINKSHYTVDRIKDLHTARRIKDEILKAHKAKG